MSTESVIFEKKGSVAILTLNRPENANTLDLSLARELLGAARRCAGDPAVRAIVLTGAGKNFSFGGDLRGMTDQAASIESYLRELTGELHAAISLFVRMDAPVITAVKGAAAGAGIGLVAMADLAVAAESSKFNMAYTSVGLTPDAGTSFFLPHIIGVRRAKELALLNRSITAAQARDWGLVNEVVPEESVMETALGIGERLAQGALHAYGKTKRLFAHAIGALETQLVLESEMIASQAAAAEGHEGIGAFLEKRKPKFF